MADLAVAPTGSSIVGEWTAIRCWRRALEELGVEKKNIPAGNEEGLEMLGKMLVRSSLCEIEALAHIITTKQYSGTKDFSTLYGEIRSFLLEQRKLYTKTQPVGMD
jgi:hypothetical protein